MGQDAVALLHIGIGGLPKKLAKAAEETGDAVLYATHNRCNHYTPDQHAWWLRKTLGPAFALHDDPRGVLFFSDVSTPRSTNYESLVRELAGEAWGV